MSIFQRIADQYTVLVCLENRLTLQYHATHTIDCGRNETGIKLTNVLVSLRTEVVALILVETQVEFRPVLDDRTVQRRQEHMVLIVNLRHRDHQQSALLSRIAVYKGRGAIRTTSVGAEQFTAQTLLQVRHHGFFKS